MIQLEPNIEKASVQICARCIYDERVNAITFDENGECNYCKQIDELKAQYGTGSSKGEKSFRSNC